MKRTNPKYTKYFKWVYDFVSYKDAYNNYKDVMTEKLFAMMVEQLEEDPQAMDYVYCDFLPRNWYPNRKYDWETKTKKVYDLILTLLTQRGEAFPLIDVYLHRNRAGIKFKEQTCAIQLNVETGERFIIPSDEVKELETIVHNLISEEHIKVKERAYGNGKSYLYVEPTFKKMPTSAVLKLTKKIERRKRWTSAQIGKVRN